MNGSVQVFYGDGRGKSTAALGTAIRAASQGKSVVIIQFLKGKNDSEQEFVKRLEPEIKLFRFEKSEEYYENLTRQEKNEEAMNIRNGLSYAKKVLLTGECDVLVLDEVLGLVDAQVIAADELDVIFESKSEDTELIFTGRVLSNTIRAHATEIYHITSEKV
ncbi:MAG: cob(I)yrinic acid a,c-diamide adenosyltransferase [Lachnospiraceae bacterium]